MNGFAVRIVVACLAVVFLAVAVIAAGVLVFGQRTFEQLMIEHGESVAGARAMFDQTVTVFFVVAVAGAAVLSVAVAALLGRWLAGPLRRLGLAARAIADGDLSVRVAGEGPVEVTSLAVSFNDMAERLAEHEKLRQEFVANAAHELRTPLTNLRGYLEALRDDVISPSRATFESLQEEVDRLVRLSRSLDALAEGDLGTRPPEPRDVDLAAAISSAVELVEPTFERRHIRWERSVPAGLQVRADPDHLAQVLANLLQNATRYTPDGGRVIVGATPRQNEVVVAVTNSGDGIPAADLPRVFDRFFRVERSRDRARGGAGIGLAIVKQLVELGGGRVGAESSAGTTRFWFSLPLI
ncbi:MAG TPA: HAMP domain-containing sensor histidine kinase [Candidatus Limnocylindria bacterium]|nr:HAMP domain-containing sensor histidine kinase [Candidatus Limnocylindria bacterium]